MIKLDIISDPICPWCYIGKAHLDRALEQRPDHPFTVEWHPFQLNPTMPKAGMDRREYLETKFGGKEGAVRAYAPVVETAERAGLKIDFEAMKRTPNTLDATVSFIGLGSKAVKPLSFRRSLKPTSRKAAILAAMKCSRMWPTAWVWTPLSCSSSLGLILMSKTSRPVMRTLVKWG